MQLQLCEANEDDTGSTNIWKMVQHVRKAVTMKTISLTITLRFLAALNSCESSNFLRSKFPSRCRKFSKEYIRGFYLGTRGIHGTIKLTLLLFIAQLTVQTALPLPFAPGILGHGLRLGADEPKEIFDVICDCYVCLSAIYCRKCCTSGPTRALLPFGKS
jgi:hypothetical protein